MANLYGRARQTLQSSSTRNAIFSKFFGPKFSSIPGNSSKLPGFGPSTKPHPSSFPSPLRLFTTSRLPVELGGVQSLMPLHSATASALFTSLLSLHAQSWGSLSDGTILDDS